MGSNKYVGWITKACLTLLSAIFFIVMVCGYILMQLAKALKVWDPLMEKLGLPDPKHANEEQED